MVDYYSNKLLDFTLQNKDEINRTSLLSIFVASVETMVMKLVAYSVCSDMMTTSHRS